MFNSSDDHQKQKDVESRKIKPAAASRLIKSDMEEEPLDCQFDRILHQTEAASDHLLSVRDATAMRIISLDKIKDLMHATYRLFRISSGIAEDFIMESGNQLMAEEFFHKFMMSEGETRSAKMPLSKFGLGDLKVSESGRDEVAEDDEDEVQEKTLEEQEFDDNLCKVLEQVSKETPYFRTQLASLEEKGDENNEDQTGLQTDSTFRLGSMEGEEEKTEGEGEDLKTSDLKQDETSDEDEDEVVEKTLEEKEFDDNLCKVLEQVNKETPYYIMQLACLEDEGENDEDQTGSEEEEEEEWMEIEFTESDKEEMDMEERNFASHQSSWESSWRRGMARNFFEDQTTLSPMHFTHVTPGHIQMYPTAFTGNSLQIYTVKIQTKGKLSWPLYVYGVVAARDSVDRRRNIIFCRTRFNSQKLTQEDPFLHLTGPSRAIVVVDPVEFEFQLKIEGRVKSEDRVLMNQTFHYLGGYPFGLYTASLGNRFCTAELNMEQLIDTVQATILGVCIGEGDPLSLFKYGGRVACFSPPQEVMKDDMHATDTAYRQVALLDSRRVKMPMGADGYLRLSRNVVSVDFQERPGCFREYAENLEVVIQAYSESGGVAAEGRVKFMPKQSNISQDACYLGGCKVEIVVAWSALAGSSIHIV